MTENTKGATIGDYVWVDDERWRRIPQPSHKRCRMIEGWPRRACPNHAQAEFRRPNGWWAYCAEHLYGHRIERGRVERLVHKDSPAAQRGLVL